MWTFRTAHGLWSICEHEGHYVLMFNGEYLATDTTPSGLLVAIEHERVEAPICGLDPATAGLPKLFSAWTCEAKRDARFRPVVFR